MYVPRFVPPLEELNRKQRIIVNDSPMTVTFPIGSLTPESLEVIRQIVREELDAALQRLMIGEQRLIADITEPQEQDEQEEIAAVLATMTPEEWETLVQRVRERKAKGE